MSATYTRWTHHEKSLDDAIVEYSEKVDGVVQDDGIAVDDEPDSNEQDNDDNDGMPNFELIAELYTTAEEDGQLPKFTRVLDDLKRSLWPGSKHTRFSFLMRLLRIKSRYQIYNTGFNTLLKLLSSAFPQSKLPESYDEAKKYPRELGIGYDKIHVCKNNCVLFRKRYAKMDVCPKCKESRWEDKDGKCVPHKVLRHFPLILRLKRMFGSSKTAEDTQWQKKNGHQLIMN